jgi:hypothetical protein
MPTCPACAEPVGEEWNFCKDCGASLSEERMERLDVDVDGGLVATDQCTCGETFYIVYEEQEASLSIDAIAEKIGLGGSYRATEPTVVGTHATFCPMCGAEVSITQLAKLKLAAILFQR